jgi:hypothetical protein
VCVCVCVCVLQAFLGLFKLFKKNLGKYAQMIGGKLPPVQDGQAKLSEKDERTVCLIINTADVLSSEFLFHHHFYILVRCCVLVSVP